MPKLHLTGNRVLEISYAQWERLVVVYHKLKPERKIQINGQEYRADEIVGLEVPPKPPKFGHKLEIPKKKPATRELTPRKYDQKPDDMKDIPPMIQDMMDRGLNVDWYFDSKRKRR